MKLSSDSPQTAKNARSGGGISPNLSPEVPPELAGKKTGWLHGSLAGSNWRIAFFSFIIGLSGAMMPGPMLTATIQASISELWAAPMVVLGHGLVELVLFLALCFGAAPLFRHRYAFIGIAMVGGLALIWMGQGMLRDVPDFSALAVSSFECETDTSRRALWLACRSGVITTVAQPYFYLWWATIGLAYIAYLRSLGRTRSATMSFFAGHILSDLVWFGLVGSSTFYLSGLLSQSGLKIVFQICGAALIGFGILFFAVAFRRFRADPLSVS